MSKSLWPLGLQHARLPCHSLSPRVCSDSCPLSWWYHPTISSSVAPSPALNLSQHQSLFQWVSSSHQVAKILELQHQSFQSGLISFRIDWFDLSAVQGALKSSLAPQFTSISSSLLSLLYGPPLTFVHDYWKNHSFVQTYVCKVMSGF